MMLMRGLLRNRSLISAARMPVVMASRPMMMMNVPLISKTIMPLSRFQFSKLNAGDSADEADIVHESSSTPFDDDYFATDSKSFSAMYQHPLTSFFFSV